MDKVKRMVTEADEFLADGDDRNADNAYKQKVRDLAATLEPDAEFSAAARAAIAVQRGTSETARLVMSNY